MRSPRESVKKLIKLNDLRVERYILGEGDSNFENILDSKTQIAGRELLQRFSI